MGPGPSPAGCSCHSPHPLRSYLQFVDFLVELRPDSLPIGKLGLQLLHLPLQLLLLVLHLLLGLVERPDLVAQVRVALLQRLLGLVQVGLGLEASESLSRAGSLWRSSPTPFRPSGVTRLNCSSCSASSSTAWVCLWRISCTWASWARVSSSSARFRTVTSCSLFALSPSTKEHEAPPSSPDRPTFPPEAAFRAGQPGPPGPSLGSPAPPELLLGGRAVQGVFQLRLEGLQLLAQVPLLLLGLVACGPLRVQVLLQVRDVGFQLPDLFQCVVLLADLIFQPG